MVLYDLAFTLTFCSLAQRIWQVLNLFFEQGQVKRYSNSRFSYIQVPIIKNNGLLIVYVSRG